MNKRLMSKTTLKILSLVIAVFIWLLAKNVQDPVIVKTFYNIPVTSVNESYLASDLKIPLMVDGKDTVNVRIKGEESVVKELEKEDITAEADMTQIISIDTTPVMVPVKVYCKGIDDDDITVTPRNIQVDIEQQESVEKTIAVSTGETQPDKNYEIGVLKANPEKVTISGPSSIINRIDRVVAQIDVTGRTESNVEIDSELKIYDKNLDELSEKQLSYLDLKDIRDNKIKIQAEFWKVQQNVKIQAHYSGTPKYGYEVNSISTVPDSISVAGTDEALKSLAKQGYTLKIPDSYIDVTDKASDFEVNVDLNELLPADVKLTRNLNSSVIATVKILPYNSKDFDMSAAEIEVVNKPEDMDIVFQQEKVTARVRAKEEDLEKLNIDAIGMKIDLKDYKTGEYEVSVTVSLPSGYELVDDIKVKVKLVPGAEKEAQEY